MSTICLYPWYFELDPNTKRPSMLHVNSSFNIFSPISLFSQKQQGFHHLLTILLLDFFLSLLQGELGENKFILFRWNAFQL